MKIKQVLIASCLILGALKGTAQSVSPREEFKVSTSQTQITLVKGAVDSVELTIVRAKHFKSVGKFSVSSPLPKGLSVEISSIPDRPDHFIMYLKADGLAEANEFYVVPSYFTSGAPKKGVLIKVIVADNLLTEKK